MSEYTIITSRNISSTLDLDDNEYDLDDAADIAQALHRTAQWLDTTVEGVVTGEYVHNGRTERIAVIATSVATGGNVARTLRWVNAANL